MNQPTVTIAGREWPVRYSTSVACECEEKFGSAPALFDKMRSDSLKEQLRAVLWLAARMLEAGQRYARLMGEPIDGCPPEESELSDLLSVGEMRILQIDLMKAITADMKRTVEADIPKNGEPTPAGK